MGTAMHYPCNYGYVPNTIADDGDPCDVLVITPFPLIPGVVVRCRAIGVLKMTDEAGGDSKVLAVPVEKLLPLYSNIQTVQDVPDLTLRQIQHFFEHYKDLEKGKWVKVEGWEGPDSAKAEIVNGVKAYEGKQQ
jgi:inorganic pyrophosphatase